MAKKKQDRAAELIELYHERSLYDNEVNELNKLREDDWLIHIHDGTMYGWKFELYKHPLTRDATPEEVEEAFGPDGPPDYSSRAKSMRRAKAKPAAKKPAPKKPAKDKPAADSDAKMPAWTKELDA